METLHGHFNLILFAFRFSFWLNFGHFSFSITHLLLKERNICSRSQAVCLYLNDVT